jgi:hypothetical protein
MEAMDISRTKYLTFRTVFARPTVIGLLQERGFRDSQVLAAEESVKPFNDAYLAVFTLQAEATEDGMLKLRIASTTVLGIQRYSINRLRWQRVHEHSGGDGLMMDLLRAHYMYQDRRLNETFATIGRGGLRRWTEMFSNGAGDLEDPPEFSIDDPDLDELNRIAGMAPDTGEDDAADDK